MYCTYLRLHVTVHDGWRIVVRAAAGKLKPCVRRDPAQRRARHCFYRQMLAYHRKAQDLAREWCL